ncbi:hypothetical protein HK096_001700, partial [Nowakowskiella sp. JEL0078]
MEMKCIENTKAAFNANVSPDDAINTFTDLNNEESLVSSENTFVSNVLAAENKQLTVSIEKFENYSELHLKLQELISKMQSKRFNILKEKLLIIHQIVLHGESNSKKFFSFRNEKPEETKQAITTEIGKFLSDFESNKGSDSSIKKMFEMVAGFLDFIIPSKITSKESINSNQSVKEILSNPNYKSLFEYEVVRRVVFEELEAWREDELQKEIRIIADSFYNLKWKKGQLYKNLKEKYESDQKNIEKNLKLQIIKHLKQKYLFKGPTLTILDYI